MGAPSVLTTWLALGGCALGPKYARPPVSLRESWSEKDDPRITTQAPIEQAWWKAFNDPTLDRLVDLAHQQNLTLQVYGLRIIEARAQLAIAFGRQFPQLQAAIAQATGNRVSEHAPNTAFLNNNFADYQVAFDVNWELDIWQKYHKGVKAQAASYLATGADYDGTLVSLTAEVARTYTLIRTFEQLIELSRQNEKVQEEGLRIAESRFRNGVATELDVTQATTLLESTRATVPLYQIDLRQAQDALCTLLGQKAGCQALVPPGKGIPVAPAQVAISVPAELLRRRPDIRSAEFNAVAQCEQIGIAKAELFPRFTLFGTIGTETSSFGGMQSRNSSLSDFFSWDSLFYIFGGSIFWPVLNYGRLTNNVRVQDARFQQLLVQYQNTVLLAAQEVEDGLAGFLRSQEAVVFQQNAVTAAQRSVELALKQYREGAVDFQRVVDTQRSLLQEQITLARTRSSVATNLIALYKALGGGWELRQGQPVVPEATRVEMQQRTNWSDYLTKPPPAQPADGAQEGPR
jgi:NodT family efflux transporter outer membrane factor (OMF) lipoprotein